MPDFVLKDILKPLRYFERRYDYINNHNTSFSINMQRILLISYSKSAVLEFCGWIEESLDDMFKRYAHNNIPQPVKRNRYLKKLIKNYGFEYDKHLYKLVKGLLTPAQYSKYISLSQNRQFLPTLKKQLTDLSKARNDAAHTNLKRSRQSYDNPSLIINKAKQIKAFLNTFSRIISKSI